jgi:hypothetical protein
MSPTATLEGHFLDPRLVMRFGPKKSPFARGKMVRPGRPRTLGEWVKAMPNRRWNPEDKTWIVTNPGPDIDRLLAELGFDVDYAAATGHITCLADLAVPVVALDDDDAGTWVYPRFAVGVEDLLPAYHEWDKARQAFWVSTPDMLDTRFILPRDVLDAAHRHRCARPFASGGADERDLSRLAHAQDDLHVPGEPVLWQPARTLFGFQASGARAVAAGHSALTDEPGLGKTVQAITALATVGTTRAVCVVPPVVLSNWKTEIKTAGWNMEVSVISPTRKIRPFPDRGVVIVADSLLASRSALLDSLIAWRPDGLIVDEAHREKGLESKRSKAVRRLAHNVRGLRIPITGTPLVSSPADLAPLLDISGHLQPVFGGYSHFMETYCRQDQMRGWVPRQTTLEDLGSEMNRHVWVRRRKADVLDLPDLMQVPLIVDVNLAGFRKTHAEILDRIREWTDNNPKFAPNLPAPMIEQAIEEMAREDGFELVSQLRKAAGLAKIDAAKDWVRDFVESARPDKGGTWDRPLIVWTHHRVVTEAMIDAVSDLGVPVDAIWGETPQSAIPGIIADFQAGRTAVLVASITAAGVGVTLTRSADALFVETDWTPALVEQALDRIRRIGQRNQMTATTMVAPGTLDERIQGILAQKAKTLNPVLGGDSDVSVVDGKDAAVAALVIDLINMAINRQPGTHRTPATSMHAVQPSRGTHMAVPERRPHGC